MKLYTLVIMVCSSFWLMSCKKMESDKMDSALNGSHGTFENNTLVVNDEPRFYRLVVPDNLDLNQENTLIFAFHGLGIDSKDFMPVYSELNTLAREMNAIIVYPGAQHGSWGLNSIQTQKDLDFFSLLLTKIKTAYRIHPERINAIGMSNGAYFCHILAKHHSEVLSSIAAHSGMVGLEFVFGINASRKYPVLLIHGTNDPIFNITTARNDLQKYQNENHPAKLIEVTDLGHEWAGSIHINDSIANFFEQHY